MVTLFILSVAPAALLMFIAYRYDTIEKEPPKLIIKLFLFGMLSVVPAIILENIGQALIAPLANNYTLYMLVEYFVVVAMSEEAVKYAFLVSTRNDKNFNYTFDGIVYGVAVGLGFATLENILYVFNYMSVGLALSRGFTAIPMHFTCAVIMGYYFGMAHKYRFDGTKGEMVASAVAAYVIPVLIHGTYDFALSTGNDAIVALTILITLVVFAVAIARIVRSSKRNTMINNGAITPPSGRPMGGYYVSRTNNESVNRSPVFYGNNQPTWRGYAQRGQGGYQQAGHQQAGYQPGYQQTGYTQTGQAGYQPGYQQTGYTQTGQAGYQQTGYRQPNYTQAGQTGYQQTGYKPGYQSSGNSSYQTSSQAYGNGRNSQASNPSGQGGSYQYSQTPFSYSNSQSGYSSGYQQPANSSGYQSGGQDNYQTSYQSINQQTPWNQTHQEPGAFGTGTAYERTGKTEWHSSSNASSRATSSQYDNDGYLQQDREYSNPAEAPVNSYYYNPAEMQSGESHDDNASDTTPQTTDPTEHDRDES
ncbi:MAG: PrsW family glutamic-type intramembrane protease [Coriobacteriales bacterium]|jgi:RsiW-degrading membrane proteinase PrsW (M82 family)